MRWFTLPPIPGARVIRSPIDGYGVIATRSFDTGEEIATIDGVIWYRGEAVDDKYSLELGDGVFLDIVDQTRWINHSCEPNAELDIEYEGRQGRRVRLVAGRPIDEGEEITFDYAFAADYAEVCRCGATTCRGYIVDPDELDLVLARRGKPPGQPSAEAAHNGGRVHPKADQGVNRPRARRSSAA